MNAVEEKKLYSQPSLALEDKDPYAPSIVELAATSPAVIQPSQQYYQQQQPQPVAEQQPQVDQTNEGPVYRFELKAEVTEPVTAPIQQQPQPNDNRANANGGQGFLSRPSNIYAEARPGESPITPMEAKPSKQQLPEQPEFEMKLVMKDEIPEPADVPKITQPVGNTSRSVEDLAMQDDADDQKRRAQERIQKLRNLSFNMNTADASTEFDSVPAYIRRNMELFGNTLTSVENFYSKYTVKPDENDKGHISSINTFLDGKKPD